MSTASPTAGTVPAELPVRTFDQMVEYVVDKANARLNSSSGGDAEAELYRVKENEYVVGPDEDGINEWHDPSLDRELAACFLGKRVALVPAARKREFNKFVRRVEEEALKQLLAEE